MKRIFASILFLLFLVLVCVQVPKDFRDFLDVSSVLNLARFENTIPVLGAGFDYLGIDQHLLDKLSYAPISNNQIMSDRHVSFSFREKAGLLDMGTKVQQALEIACMLRAQPYVQSPAKSLSVSHNMAPIAAKKWEDYIGYQLLDPSENFCKICSKTQPLDPNLLRYANKIRTPIELERIKHDIKLNLHIMIPKEDLGLAITLLSATLPRCKSARVYPTFAIDTKTWFQRQYPTYLALKIRLGDDSSNNKACAKPTNFEKYIKQVPLNNITTLFIMGNYPNDFKQEFTRLYTSKYTLIFEQDLRMIRNLQENYKKYLAAYAIAEGATHGLIQIQRKTKWDIDGKLPFCKIIYYAPREQSKYWWTIYSKAHKILH
jgi:hypothetical protein